jgi:hypothetical protein
MVNGGEGREGLEEIFARSDHACSGFLFLLLFFQIFLSNAWLGDAR